MNVRIGVCQWSIPANGAENCLALASKLELDGVEPDLGSYEQNFPLSQKDQQDNYERWREQYHLVYPSLAVNALCQYGMSDFASQKTVEMAIAKAVDTAASLGIPIVQLPSFVKGDIASDEGYKSTIRSLRFACQHADGMNIIIGSENALPADKQLEMIEDVGSAHFKIYFDTRNLFSMKGYDSVQMLQKLLPHICEIHIKDGLNDGPAVPLGEGNSGFYDAIQVLKKENYRGWLLLENSYESMASMMNISADDLMRKDIATVKGSLHS